MPRRDEIVNVNAASDVSSIQITINLGTTPVEEPPEGPREPLRAPQGTFFRQVFEDPAAPHLKQIRMRFVPDDPTENITTDLPEPTLGERSKWRQLLGDQLSLDEVDAGDIVVRITEEGGTVVWLPGDASQEPVINRFRERTPGEPGGASLRDFLDCWFSRGRTAAAASNCWSRL